jgi:hypothetical protein
MVSAKNLGMFNFHPGKLNRNTNLKPTTNRPFTDPSQPIFRLGWCGNDKPSPRRNFQSIRRSGDCYSIVVYCFLKVLMVSAKSLGMFNFHPGKSK